MALSTASRVLALTCVDPFITRDTVPRPTPARAATASSVGRSAGRPGWGAMEGSSRPRPRQTRSVEGADRFHGLEDHVEVALAPRAAGHEDDVLDPALG